MADWSKPTLTSSYTNFVTEVKDRDVEAALWFEGMSPTNLPTNAKRLNTSTGRFEKWNGSAWVDAVATFTFPALEVAGVSTFTGVATFTANPVMNGGTANGVPYLNGSKVLTSGSALTFDGTNLAVGASATSGSALVYLNKAAGSSDNGVTGATLFLNTGSETTTANLIRFNGAIAQALFYGRATNADAHVWGGSSSGEFMRLTSTGLGIGTSSPGAKLHVKVGTDQNLYVSSGGGVLGLFGVNDAVSAPAPLQIQGTDLRFNTGTLSATECMRIDSSGNLGLGVTPSAWAVNSKAFQIGRSGVLQYTADNAQIQVGNNYYQTGLNAYTYLRSAFAGHYSYSDFDGAHRWLSAPSGTAGNAISFTQALTLDANANLIGAGTGYWRIPQGTTAQRPTGAAGMIRYNSTLSKYEGHNGTAWSSIGGGATGGGADDIFVENGQTVTTDYTITTNKNAMSAGAITIASGITVTVPSGSTWVVV